MLHEGGTAGLLRKRLTTHTEVMNRHFKMERSEGINTISPTTICISPREQISQLQFDILTMLDPMLQIKNTDLSTTVISLDTPHISSRFPSGLIWAVRVKLLYTVCPLCWMEQGSNVFAKQQN